MLGSIKAGKLMKDGDLNYNRHGLIKFFLPYFGTCRCFIEADGRMTKRDTGMLATFKDFTWLGAFVYKRVHVEDTDLY